jgi:hypothetical protein
MAAGQLPLNAALAASAVNSSPLALGIVLRDLRSTGTSARFELSI